MPPMPAVGAKTVKYKENNQVCTFCAENYHYRNASIKEEGAPSPTQRSRVNSRVIRSMEKKRSKKASLLKSVEWALMKIVHYVEKPLVAWSPFSVPGGSSTKGMLTEKRTIFVISTQPSINFQSAAAAIQTPALPRPPDISTSSPHGGVVPTSLSYHAIPRRDAARS